MMSGTFTLNQISKGLDVRRETIREWYRRGWITPSIKDEKTKGVAALYGISDVLKIILFKKLIARGICRSEAFGMVKAFAEGAITLARIRTWPKVFAILIRDDHKECAYCWNAGDVNDVIEKGCGEDGYDIMFIALERVKAELDRVMNV